MAPSSAAAGASNKPPPAVNAFARLLEGSKKQFCREVFVLSQAAAGGGLTWSWGVAVKGGCEGGGGWCWEAEMKHPLHKDGVLVLRTNLPPAASPAASSAGGGGEDDDEEESSWRASGLSVSLLKSALQKNVRCSYGPKALRTALELLLRYGSANHSSCHPGLQSYGLPWSPSRPE